MIAFTLIFRTGLFHDACHDWKRQAADENTWDQFKVDFTVAHQEIRESQTTSQAAVFHAVNADFDMQQEIVEALANLVTATSADQRRMADLTATNTQLTLELATAHCQCTNVNTELAALRLEMSGLKQGKNPTAVSRIFTPRTVRRYSNTNYCWSHRYDLDPRHTSVSCNIQKAEHENKAALADNKGGSQRNKSLV